MKNDKRNLRYIETTTDIIRKNLIAYEYTHRETYTSAHDKEKKKNISVLSRCCLAWEEKKE